LKTAFLVFAPGIALGLYIGRLLSELWAFATGSTSFLLALVLTLSAAFFCVSLFRRIPFTQTWPALFLLLYLFFPESSLPAALGVALFTILVSWQLANTAPGHSNSRHLALVAALLVAAAFFLLYGVTLAPDILPADNGEFQLVAANLGVAHPPGFSLYTMLAHLITRLPAGSSPAYRVNLLSAVTSALTLAAVYGAVFYLTKRHLAALTAVVALGTATTFWAQATTANIRSLSALIAALMFLALLAFYRTTRNSEGEKENHMADRYLILFALVLGFGVTHHASLAFMGLIGAIFILLVDPSLMKSPRRWWRPLFALLIGVLPLLYLPLRAASGARGSSPELATWPGFLEHVLALGFRGDLFTYLEPALLWERFKIMGNVLTFQFELWLLFGMALGFLFLLWRDWRLAFLLGGAFGLHTFITATYRAPQTVEYMLPAYIPLALLLGFAVGESPGSWHRLAANQVRLPFREILLAFMLVAALWQLTRNYPSYAWLHQDTTARDYAQFLLQKAPPDSVILSDWHWVTPLWYLQEVEGQRLDVSVRFVFPEGESYAETWVRRVQEELDNGRPVISTHFEPGAFAALPNPEPLQEAFMFRQEPRLNLPDEYTPLDQMLGGSIRLLGYQLEAPTGHIGDENILNLAWQPLDGLDPQTTLFAHLSSSDGQLVAQHDLPARPQQQGISITQFRLSPYLGTQPGKYVLLVGAYDPDPLLGQDGQERIPLAHLSLSPNTHPQVTSNNLRRAIPGPKSMQLVGYDWDNTLPEQQRLYLHWQTADGFQTEVRDGNGGTLPSYAGPWGVLSNRWSRVTQPGLSHYIPFGQGIVWHGDLLNANQSLAAGRSLTLPQRFLSSQPVMRDHTVSVRLIGFEEDGYHWAWWDLDDAIPAMGAIPTLKWIGGSQVRSPHFVQVNDDAPSGQQIGAALNLYDAFTNRLLPILDERITADYAWIPLGMTNVGD
jgi:hypothetical protein